MLRTYILISEHLVSTVPQEIYNHSVILQILYYYYYYFGPVSLKKKALAI